MFFLMGISGAKLAMHGSMHGLIDEALLARSLVRYDPRYMDEALCIDLGLVRDHSLIDMCIPRR